MIRHFFFHASSSFSSAHQCEFFSSSSMNGARTNTLQIPTRFFKAPLKIDATFSIRKGYMENAIRSVLLKGGLSERAG
jgi:hypothetical protein